MNQYNQYSANLSHHGIKGQKWGFRRFQNEDGSLTVAGKERYGSGTTGNARFRPSDKSQQSKNWQINRMGGRKINASYETRRKRGEALTKAGRTKAGAVGRYFGRNIAYGLAAGAANVALSRIGLAAAMNNNDAIRAGAKAASTVINTAATMYTVSNIIKTYQDISDMNTYEDSKSRKK